MKDALHFVLTPVLCPGKERRETAERWSEVGEMGCTVDTVLLPLSVQRAIVRSSRLLSGRAVTLSHSLPVGPAVICPGSVVWSGLALAAM